jgi:hypothetical protein
MQSHKLGCYVVLRLLLLWLLWAWAWDCGREISILRSFAEHFCCRAKLFSARYLPLAPYCGLPGRIAKLINLKNEINSFVKPRQEKNQIFTRIMNLLENAWNAQLPNFQLFFWFVCRFLVCFGLLLRWGCGPFGRAFWPCLVYSMLILDACLGSEEL